jgi:hypothetical protein
MRVNPRDWQAIAKAILSRLNISANCPYQCSLPAAPKQARLQSKGERPFDNGRVAQSGSRWLLRIRARSAGRVRFSPLSASAPGSLNACSKGRRIH